MQPLSTGFVACFTLKPGHLSLLGRTKMHTRERKDSYEQLEIELCPWNMLGGVNSGPTGSLAVLRLVRLLAAVCAVLHKNTPIYNIYTSKNIIPTRTLNLNVTNFLHSNFRSVQWIARGGVNGNVPACNN